MPILFANLPRACLLACLFSLNAVAVELPDLGDVARVSLTEARESALGREVMHQIRRDKDYLNDVETTEYLNNLGERLAAANPDPSHQFRLFAVRDPTINAFALPGGYIGVHTGLISAARTESELAGVLAHEMAHVTQNHIARIVDAQKGNALQTLAALAVAILAARSDNPQLGQAAIVTAQAMSMQNELDYTRDHEREADRIGLQTLISSGFDPQGMETFFERLQSHSRLYESPAPAYLRTHPLTHDRIADMQGRLADVPRRFPVDSPEFLYVRAKIRAAEGDANEAVKRFQAELVTTPSDLALHYGLAYAAFRAGDQQLALATLNRLDKTKTSAMIDTLAAQVLSASGQSTKALAWLQESIQHHGTSLAMADAYAGALLQADKAAQAKQTVTEYLRIWPDEIVLLDRLAQANFALGKRAEGYLAQAESLRQQDLTAPAIEQLQLARKAGDGDYYTQSIIDSRMRELQERLKQAAAK